MAPPAVARLHLVTPTGAAPADVRAAVATVVAAGAPWIQVRTKAGTDRDRWGVADELVRTAQAGGAVAVVNDRVDLALAAGAVGVHLGAEDLPVARARAVLGPDAVIGATCRTPDDARRAADEGADYLGCGPVHPTTTKVGLPPPIGLAGLEAVSAATALPVIAISGITADRVPAVLDAGAHGVAVVAAVFAAPDPGAEARRFLAALGLPAAAPIAAAPAVDAAGAAPREGAA